MTVHVVAQIWDAEKGRSLRFSKVRLADILRRERYPINAPNLTPAQVRERAEIAADAEIIQTFIASLLILEIPSQLGHAPMAAR